MNVNEVIKYPILSEKTYMQMEKNVYTFAVDFRTNKAEVKKVVEFIFDVKVEKVNISTVQKKPKKLGKFEGFTNRYKKAVVSLKDGKINIFPDEAPVEEAKKEAKPAKAKKEDIKEVKEISDAEKKAADKIAAKLAEKTETKTEVKQEVKAEVKQEVKAEVKQEVKAEVKQETKADSQEESK